MLRDAAPARLPVAILRAIEPRQGVEVRAGDEMPTLFGHFSVFDRWYEINSHIEGRFMERFQPGAFKKTIAESRSQMRVLFQHGMDPQIGDKVLGPITRVEEDSVGAAYEVPLLDTSYNRDLVPGLQAGVYGASMRFTVVKDKWNDRPDPSRDNPDGLPERTVTEARVPEFGPVTFGANPGASSGVRSLTDTYYDFLRSRSPETYEEALRSIISFRTLKTGTPEPGAAASADEPPPGTPTPSMPGLKSRAMHLQKTKELAR